MTPIEQKRISKWNSGLNRRINITLALSDDQQKDSFSSFCEELASLAPKVRIKKTDAGDILSSYIMINNNIRYHAIPLGEELEPFLDILSNPAKKPILDDNTLKKLKKITVSAFLRLFITQMCPHCPVVFRQLAPLTLVSDQIHLTVIDGTLFHEKAQAENILSAPTLLLDDSFRWTGSIPLEEIAEIIINRDPASLSAESLEGIIQEGNAADVAKMMLDNRMIFPEFIKLLVHEKWPVRLGAMVAMEEIADKDIDLASQAVSPLWDFFDNADEQVKGDIAYIIGKVGDNETIHRLKSIMSGDYDTETKEAATEAVENITKRESR